MRKINHMDVIKLGGLNVNNIRYANDTAINVIAKESREFGLKINKRKTFSMTISKKNAIPKCKIEIDELEIKQIEKFEYLGSLITLDAKSDQEIKRRIGIAKKHLNLCTMCSLQEILTIKLNLDLKSAVYGVH